MNLPVQIKFCEWCFKITEELVGKKRRFCSFRCSGQYAQSFGVRKYNKDKKCKFCKELFKSKYKRRHFCDRKCHNEYNKINKVAHIRNSDFGNQYFKYKGFRVKGLLAYRFCRILDRLKLKNNIVNWNYGNHIAGYFVAFSVEKTNGVINFYDIRQRPNGRDNQKNERLKELGHTYKIIKGIKTLERIEKRIQIPFYMSKISHVFNGEDG